MSTLWKDVLGEIEVAVSHATFMTWFKGTELLDQTDETLTIGVPNVFAKRQFEVKFDNQIRSVLKSNGVAPKTITYTVKTKNIKKSSISRESSPLLQSVSSSKHASSQKNTSNRSKKIFS